MFQGRGWITTGGERMTATGIVLLFSALKTPHWKFRGVYGYSFLGCSKLESCKRSSFFLLVVASAAQYWFQTSRIEHGGSSGGSAWDLDSWLGWEWLWGLPGHWKWLAQAPGVGGWWGTAGPELLPQGLDVLGWCETSRRLFRGWTSLRS